MAFCQPSKIVRKIIIFILIHNVFASAFHMGCFERQMLNMMHVQKYGLPLQLLLSFHKKYHNTFFSEVLRNVFKWALQLLLVQYNVSLTD